MPFYKGTAYWNFYSTEESFDLEDRPVFPNTGFSESFEFEAPNNVSAANAWYNGAYPKNRSLITANQWKLYGMRLSELYLDDTVTPCKIRQRYVSGCTNNYYHGQAGDADLPWAAAFYDLIGLAGNVFPGQNNRPRRFLLRGIPDDWWIGAAQAITPAAQDRILIFFAWLTKTLKGGHVKAQLDCSEININLYTKACFRRLANRQIGRPIGGLRGRRKAAIVPS